MAKKAPACNVKDCNYHNNHSSNKCDLNDVTKCHFYIISQDKKYKNLGYKELQNISKFNNVPKSNRHWINLGWHNKHLLEFIDFVSKMDFGCDFTSEGCVGNRYTKKQWFHHESNNRPKSTIPRCCCVDCGNEIGYLRKMPRNKELLGIIQEAYEPKFGFWSEQGCKLPHRLRSKTCLSYRCVTIRENKKLPLLNLVDDIINSYRSPEKKIKSFLKIIADKDFIKMVNKYKNIIRYSFNHD